MLLIHHWFKFKNAETSWLVNHVIEYQIFQMVWVIPAALNIANSPKWFVVNVIEVAQLLSTTLVAVS